MLQLCGCRIIDAYRNDPKRIEREHAEEVFRLLIDKDTDALIELFSEDARENHDLEAEWEVFFEAIDGDLESYRSVYFPIEGYGKDQNGEVFDSHLFVNYNNVTTDTGAVYSDFGYYLDAVDPNYPELEGIDFFCFTDPDTGEEYMVGGVSEEYLY